MTLVTGAHQMIECFANINIFRLVLKSTHFFLQFFKWSNPSQFIFVFFHMTQFKYHLIKA